MQWFTMGHSRAGNLRGALHYSVQHFTAGGVPAVHTSKTPALQVHTAPAQADLCMPCTLRTCCFYRLHCRHDFWSADVTSCALLQQLNPSIRRSILQSVHADEQAGSRQ
jgi:hypothetical protein